MKLGAAHSSIAFIPIVMAWLHCATTQGNGLPKPREVLQHSQAESRTRVTFAKDIAPIVFSQCGSCHRPHGSAPFSLLTYSDVREHAEKIVKATRSRHMPPWKPEPGYGEFAGVRRLTDDQIALIDRWVSDGAVEGDPRDAPPVPEWHSAWQLGEPDLVVTMPVPYQLRATGDDMYRHFVIPIPIADRKYIRAWELRVNNAHVVHHATMEFDRTGASRLRDQSDPAPGYEGLIAHSVMAPDGYFLDWAPGHSPYVAPSEMSFPIEKESDLVLMLHLRPTGTPEDVQASVGLYFSKTAPTRVPALLRLTRQDLDIPAGAPAYVVTSSFTLPVPVEVHTVQAHAHNLARQIEGFAIFPDGTTRWLLRINDWDFNWQGVYRYATPVALPAGATVVMRWTYDNSDDNPRNPNHPPRRVIFGQRTSDEMSELWFQVVPQNQRDRRTLVNALRIAVRPENLKGYEMMLQATPDSASLHDDAALLYVEAGNVERAVAHFTDSVRLQPDSAAARYNRGTALLALGKREDARRDFELALQLDPDYANAYRSLGIMFQEDGRLDEAVERYRQAIRRAPKDAVSHHRLGMALHLLGDFEEGVAQYRQALRIHPDDVDTMVDLAWSLATTSVPTQRDPEEALRLAELARELTDARNSVLFDVLAAAQAAVGRFNEAVGSAEQALALARAQGDGREVEAITARLELYRQRRPFFQPR
jgi:predicted CXXCH cytochrome family protein